MPAALNPFTTYGWCPGVVGVAADGFPELGADEYEGVLLVVASFMESSNTKIMFWCSEYSRSTLDLARFI